MRSYLVICLRITTNRADPAKHSGAGVGWSDLLGFDFLGESRAND